MTRLERPPVGGRSRLLSWYYQIYYTIIAGTVGRYDNIFTGKTKSISPEALRGDIGDIEHFVLPVNILRIYRPGAPAEIFLGAGPEVGLKYFTSHRFNFIDRSQQTCE